MIPALRILSFHSAGLVAKKDALWAKDSIDYLCVVQRNGVAEVWGVEIKSRLTQVSVSREREQMYKCRNRYHDGCGDKYISISSSNVHKYLHVLGERYQVLQHAYVYNLKKIVYLVGDNHSAIIQGIIVEFEPSLLYDYGRVLFSLKEIVFNWIPVYNNESG